MFKRQKIERVEDDPWKRNIERASFNGPDDMIYFEHGRSRPKFQILPENKFLDIATKTAALRASPSLVSLVSFSGEKEIFQCSGTIIETNDTSSVILTCADLIRVRCPTKDETDEICISDDGFGQTYESCMVADSVTVIVHLFDGRMLDGRIITYDFHYNLVAVKIQSDASLEAACLKLVDDSINVGRSPSHLFQKQPFQLIPHSDSYNLTPGDVVIALGRYCKSPYDLMAAPGEFSIMQCEDLECKELFRANCRITRSGVGGPLINCFGEVIGICFYELGYTPFLPVNLTSKWWDHYKRNGEIHRPLLSMALTNLYAVRLGILDVVIQKFPNTSKGVFVEEVVPGSSAHLAGICPNDVIIQFGGKRIRNFLELLETMWDQIGSSVELVVQRISDGSSLHLSMVMDEVPSEKFYRWPLLEYRW